MIRISNVPILKLDTLSPSGKIYSTVEMAKTLAMMPNTTKIYGDGDLAVRAVDPSLATHYASNFYVIGDQLKCDIVITDPDLEQMYMETVGSLIEPLFVVGTLTRLTANNGALFAHDIEIVNIGYSFGEKILQILNDKS